MIVLVPMGGLDDKQASEFPYGKHLAEIGRRPLIEHVHENLAKIPGAQFVFVIGKDCARGRHLDVILRLLSPNCRVVVSEGITAGAPCTALLASEHIGLDEPLIIANSDQIISAALGEIVEGFLAAEWDGATIVFDSIHPRWSFVKLDESGMVLEAAEKRPISRNATAGFYFFRRGRDFIEAAQSMIRKEAREMGRYFVCPVFNEMILRQQRIGVCEIPRNNYFSLSSKRDMAEYEAFLKQRARSDKSSNR